MKRRQAIIPFITLALYTVAVAIACTSKVQEEVIDLGASIIDTNFKKYCYDNFDINQDGKISSDEALSVQGINVQFNEGIVSIQGIEIFENIEYSYFSQCINLKDANLYNFKHLREVGFANCTNINSIVLPETLEFIGDYTFYKCVGLTAINIPKNVRYIGDYAFAGCTGITTIKLPEALEVIYKRAFSDCASLKIISFNKGLLSIGDEAFWGCIGLNNVSLPATLQEIGNWCFIHDQGINTVFCYAITPPKAMNGIFMGCTGLKSITVPTVSVAAYKSSFGWNSYSSKILGGI